MVMKTIHILGGADAVVKDYSLYSALMSLHVQFQILAS